MSDDDEFSTRLRREFAHSAQKIPTGPPPNQRSLNADGREVRHHRGRRVLAAAGAAGVISIGGVLTVANLAGGDDPSSVHDADTSSTNPRATQPPRTLDCPTKKRADATLDEFGPRGFDTPRAAVMRFVDTTIGESVEISEDGRGTHAWLLRPNDTARVRLDLHYRADIGWYVTTFETCGNGRLGPIRSD